MKNIISFLSLSFLVITISCNKEEEGLNGVLEPSQIQRALVVETTGTWCSACPYGAEILMQVDHDYGDQILPVAVHSGDDLSTPTSDAFDVNFPTTGVPNFYVGNTNAGQSPTVPINTAIFSTATAGVGHEWEKVGQSYNVTSRVNFYSADNGEFYVGCYFIHNPIDACGSFQQTAVALDANGCSYWADDAVTIGAHEDPPGSQNWVWEYLIEAGSAYTHQHVIGGHAGLSIWGEPIGTSSVSSGESYDFNFTISPQNNWTESGHILTVLWKKNGGTYDFVNGYMK